MTANSLDPILEIVAEQRALAILRLLKGPLRGAGNEDLLLHLLAAIAFRCSHDVLLRQLDGLEGCGLVKLDKVDKLVVVDLTRKGAEVAEGVTDAEGVARPGPECPY